MMETNIRKPAFGAAVLLFTKPLQLLNAACIARELGLHKPVAIFVGQSVSGFAEFLAFARGLYEGEVFRQIITIDSLKVLPEALSLFKYDSLFINDDRVSNYHILRKLKTRYLVVYEEGVGTYMGDYKYMISKVRYLKWKLISWFTGCGLDFGESRLTDYLIVQYPDVLINVRPYMASRTLTFSGNVPELLKYREAWFSLIHGVINLGNASRPALVLGTWTGAQAEDLEFIRMQDHDFVLYKAHPHTGREVSGVTCILKQAWIPAEALILYLLQSAPQLVVYHYSSSVEFYSRSLPSRVRFHSFTNDFRYSQAVTAMQGLDTSSSEHRASST